PQSRIGPRHDRRCDGIPCRKEKQSSKPWVTTSQVPCQRHRAGKRPGGDARMSGHVARTPRSARAGGSPVLGGLSMASIVETLGKELEQIDREYSAEFAGQSRLTRDVDSLDRLVERTQSVLDRVDQIPSAARGPDLVRVREAAAQSLS